jgi:hypothetical protein
LVKEDGRCPRALATYPMRKRRSRTKMASTMNATAPAFVANASFPPKFHRSMMIGLEPRSKPLNQKRQISKRRGWPRRQKTRRQASLNTLEYNGMIAKGSVCLREVHGVR